MNENFINIKVDREERPDLDETYMQAVVMVTGQGGWPLSVFLTPNLKPFFGGTYFPPGKFTEILVALSRAYRQDRAEVVEDFQAHMFAQSQPKPEMIDLISRLKAKYGLKVATVSNEGRELTVHRIKNFNLGVFVDFFISSCFVHIRKPDVDFYQLALDCAQVQPEQTVYIDDRPMFVEVACNLGIRCIHHLSYELTRESLAALGLSLEE